MIVDQEQFDELFEVYEAANEKTLTGVGPMGMHMRLAKMLYEDHGIHVADRTQATLQAKCLLNDYLESKNLRLRIR